MLIGRVERYVDRLGREGVLIVCLLEWVERVV